MILQFTLWVSRLALTNELIGCSANITLTARGRPSGHCVCSCGARFSLMAALSGLNAAHLNVCFRNDTVEKLRW